MKKHQRLAEAEMKKKALALELKRERELRRAKEDMYEDKRVIYFKKYIKGLMLCMKTRGRLNASISCIFRLP